MTSFGLAAALQTFYAGFVVYCLLMDPWNVRDFAPLAPQEMLRSLIFATFPHLFLGAFAFFTRAAQPCMIYLAFLSMEIALQLHQDWLPYAFGMIDSDRLFRLMTETGQADRILPKWPGRAWSPVPTTESTYRMGFLLLLTFVSTAAILMSPKIAVRHGNMLLTFCSLFFLLPLVQFWYGGSFDIGLLVAPVYTILYGLTVYILIRIKEKGNTSNENPAPQTTSKKVKTE